MELKIFYETIGQDYAAVLNRMMGNEAFLSSMLGKFADDHTMDALEAAMQNGEPKAIFHQAHSLKGVAENLGLKPLYEALFALTEITRNGGMEGAEQAFVQVQQEYEQVLCLLNTVVPAQ